MAMAVLPPRDRKRVKVYELRENDWYDRGTGFCTGQVLEEDEPRIYVESEDEPNRVLLETRITKDDAYQKQQDTLIVWTDPSGMDMALSFQEAEGCAVIWEFLHDVQQHLLSLAAAEDALSDDLENYQSVMLPPPELRNLPEIEQITRMASMTQQGRDALCKCVIRDDYISKLACLVSVAEDLESLEDLHRLCNIMKTLILLNDNTIIETVVADSIILGVVGALEYDPEFGDHKANHRQYLADQTRYKEVVPIRDPAIRRKIRSTWRLQYLKDVVLARILDDPTFSVLNSLIYFNQVEVVNHIQTNGPFLKELFGVFDPRNTDAKRKDDAVRFLHQCTGIAKNLQAQARASLFANFISHGLFAVIAFAIKHPNPAIRTIGIDILVALLDHDPGMMRGYMLKAVNDKKTPLTDTLIDLLHTEADLGVKNQLADAIKILLDPQITLPDTIGRTGPDYFTKLRPSNPISDAFVQHHFDESAKRLFMPLKRLENHQNFNDLTYQEVSLYAHLVDILNFFVRQHLYRSRNFIQNESLTSRVAQLLRVRQKHLKLTALKFFRTLISLQDTFYQALMTHNNTFGMILDVVYETMPRDSLLNSACLEMFEFIRRENVKSLILHIVEKYRDKLMNITYVDTFQNLILRYDQMQGYGTETDSALFSHDEETTTRHVQVNGQRWHGVKEMDPAEEEYYNTSDDEEEWQRASARQIVGAPPIQNGAASPSVRSLVDYPDDDDEIEMNMETEVVEAHRQQLPSGTVSSVGDGASVEVVTVPSASSSPSLQNPLERLSEKRRREEEEDDELVKLSAVPKRRSSASSGSGSGNAGTPRRRKSLSLGSATTADNKATAQNNYVGNHMTGGSGPRRIAINFTRALKASVPALPSVTTVSADESMDKENRGNPRGDEGG